MMGARSDEICSRRVRDIKFEGEIAYLAISDSKNKSSSRSVPFPDSILEKGFLEYRYHGREEDEYLFPELIAQGVGERHSEAFGNRFTHYRVKVKAYHPLVDFHAFRHNVTTTLENAPGVKSAWVDEITGHASAGRTSESTRYTKLIYLTNLKFALDQIRINVDLSHLRYDGPKGLAAPGAHDAIKIFRELAEREMRKKQKQKPKQRRAS